MNSESDTLAIKLKGALASKIKEVARAQNVTYASLCRAALMHAVMKDGREVMMSIYGDPELPGCERIKDEIPS